jgi:GNAT superfamily N-acetyltransferase
LTLSAPELLSERHDVTRFRCGSAALDAWLREFALRNQQRDFTRVVVVHEALRIAGFYGVAPAAVIAVGLPRSIRTGQPPNPVPCVLLGQLATDLDYRGRGLGAALLADALRRCVTGAAQIGGRAVVVKAIDDRAAAFYRRYGFIPARDDPHTLFRSIQDIAASLAMARRG